MKLLLIIGHQRKGSFCHAIAEAAIEQLREAVTASRELENLSAGEIKRTDKKFRQRTLSKVLAALAPRGPEL